MIQDLKWVQRETRPDVSAVASLGVGSIKRSTVQDLCDANTAVERLKAEPYLGIKLPHIPLHKVRWAALHDASWANAAEDHSQGAFLVGATSMEQRSISIRSVESQASLSETKMCKYVGCRNSDHV